MHMTAILIAGGSFAALVTIGAWLRWAVGPVTGAYRIGVDMGGMLKAKNDKDAAAPQKPGRALEAVLAWLMPLRAARIIHEEREDMQLLIRALAYATSGSTGPVLRERPNGSAWYDRPLPVAALAALLRPARVVRKLRSNEEALVYMIDAMLAQERKHQEAGQLVASSK
jgi:hypothetical protein